MDSSKVVDTSTLPGEAPLPTPSPRPSSTCNIFTYHIPSFSAATFPPRDSVISLSRPPLTLAALLQMGQLALSADHRASRIEASISGMVHTTLADVVTSLRSTNKVLATRIEVCEHG